MDTSIVININDDESGDAAFYISYDDTVHSILKRDIFDAGWSEDNGFLLKKYNKDNMSVEELSYEFNDLKELQDKINFTKIMNMTYETKLGLDRKTYFINMKFDTKAIDELLKKNLISKDDRENNEIYDYIKDVTLSSSITVPEKLIESNCTKSTDKNTGVWSYKISQIDENTEIKIIYSVKNYSMIICLCILFLIFIKILSYYIKKALKKWKRLFLKIKYNIK